MTACKQTVPSLKQRRASVSRVSAGDRVILHKSEVTSIGSASVFFFFFCVDKKKSRPIFVFFWGFFFSRLFSFVSIMVYDARDSCRSVCHPVCYVSLCARAPTAGIPERALGERVRGCEGLHQGTLVPSPKNKTHFFH